MKLEHLPGCSLLRLYDFDAAQAVSLRQLCSSLADGSCGSIALQDLPWAEPVGDCRLVLKAGCRDEGIVPTREANSFECVLTQGTWDNVAGLTEPFCAAPRQGYLWLVAMPGGIWLLLSSDGRW